MQVPTDVTLITLNVTFLNTNIPHSEAPKVVQDYLDLHPSKGSYSFLLDLLDLVLEKNYFKFQDQFNFQNHSVTMCMPRV